MLRKLASIRQNSADLQLDVLRLGTPKGVSQLSAPHPLDCFEIELPVCNALSCRSLSEPLVIPASLPAIYRSAHNTDAFRPTG